MVEIQLMGLSNSFDHESRHNSHRTEEIHDTVVTEDTPLLRRFPAAVADRRSPVTTVVVTLLLLILLSGIIIGIYLLVLQTRSENVLPPVEEMPLQLVSRVQWDHGRAPAPMLALAPRRAREVLVVQTDTRQCHSTVSCVELLLDIQNKTSDGQNLPYNFLVSSNGQTYEALGWRQPSSMFPQYSGSALVLAFIGNFTTIAPTHAQLTEANKFFAVSVSRKYLDPAYTVIGKTTKSYPETLFSSLKQLPQWDSELSDKSNT
ncbi:peptidoglycan-recognition protein SB2-like isoform X1 [Ostrinia nubilalis]|uniref:peptidoglycan-recognition protein SB2-like isoform X1 n=1 Tax=Ostrinia nubilalis TaxID=29057 RepID=UPI003082464A